MGNDYETETEIPTNPLKDVPSTGDNSHLELWITLMVVSLLGLCAMIVYRPRKRKRSNNG